MESLLDGTSSIMKFFIAFVVVFALIAVTAWLIRRFGTGTLGGMGTRGRAPRLAVIEAGAVDGRRKLVLIRRDNTEHLLMIGGPTDIVVEANIVRGQSTREAGNTRASSAAETLPRALPAAEETNWPLQPEATPRNGRATRPAALDDSAHWALPPEPAAAPAPAAKRSRSAETLAGLAAELSVRPSEPAAVAPPARPAPAAEAPRPKPAPAPAASSAAADQNLADMASRLEAALRRPGAAAPAPAPRPAAPKPAAEASRVAPPVTPPAPPPVTVAPPVAPPTAPEAPPIAAAPVVTIEADKPANKPAKQPDDVFGSLEEEMANLLGRPDGKPS